MPSYSANDHTMSREHRRLYKRLQRLAEQHGTSVRASSYRRG